MASNHCRALDPLMSRTDKQEDAFRTQPAAPRKSGRAAFDQDGRGIWEWQTATGVFERDVTLEQLASLEDSGLAIVEDDRAGRTFDARATAAPKQASRATASPKPSLLKRLFDR